MTTRSALVLLLFAIFALGSTAQAKKWSYEKIYRSPEKVIKDKVKMELHLAKDVRKVVVKTKRLHENTTFIPSTGQHSGKAFVEYDGIVFLKNGGSATFRNVGEVGTSPSRGKGPSYTGQKTKPTYWPKETKTNLDADSVLRKARGADQ